MLRLYNTRTRRLEPFSPLHPPTVGLYTCGPTVYGTAHLGNLRTYLFEDVLRRVLERNGLIVNHVMNVTDVGHLTDDADQGQDKVEEAAKRQHRTARDIAREHETEFFRDLERLGIQKPTTVLHASEQIDIQIDLVRQLEAKGFTYRIADGVYFDTAKFERYGQLSGQHAAAKKAGARIDVNPDKRHPSDFALWKFSRPEDHRQMEWPSPWGTGFPGWHLECSAMSMSRLGPQFDIHCGGIDHIAVHHENEIAQSEAATGLHPFVNIWLHGEFLVMPSKRMGKSEGNAITLDRVLERGLDPLAFRYFTLQAHYRTPLTFSWAALDAAAEGLKNLRRTVEALGDEAKIGCAEFEQRFFDAVNDDLNTAKALAVIRDVLDSPYPPYAKRQTINAFDAVLGLGLADLRKTALPADVQAMADQRKRSRAAKDFQTADTLRQRLADRGYSVEDASDGQHVRPT